MASKRETIAREFARRKVAFHRDENWEKINCFCLFSWGYVSRYLVGNPGKIKNFKEGLITTNMRRENKYIWCKPTKEFYEKEIQPFVDKFMKMHRQDVYNVNG